MGVDQYVSFCKYSIFHSVNARLWSALRIASSHLKFVDITRRATMASGLRLVATMGSNLSTADVPRRIAFSKISKRNTIHNFNVILEQYDRIRRISTRTCSANTECGPKEVAPMAHYSIGR
ncbi:hypothetical protein COOONC_23497 [Cooperia oncophora]